MSRIEIWKDITGYEGLYQVSNTGKVKSFLVNNRDGVILSQSENGMGYLKVTLYRNNRKYSKNIHQLVAEAFIKNSNAESFVVNHKDGNKLNNHIENLEWVSQSENQKHAYRTGLKIITNKKPVRCLETGVVFDSTHEAAKAMNVSQGNLYQCCIGARGHTGGYSFSFDEARFAGGERE